MVTARAVEIKRKMESKEKEIEQWTLNNGIPMEMKIMDKVKDRLEEIIDVDVNVQSLLPPLPIEDRKSIKHFLCFTTLQKVSSYYHTIIILRSPFNQTIIELEQWKIQSPSKYNLV